MTATKHTSNRRNRTMIRLYQARIDDEHLDSYWYDGSIAETKDYELYVSGESELEEGYEAPKNDQDLEALYEEDAFWEIKWFYITSLDGTEKEAVSGNYDEVMEELVEWQKRKDQKNEQVSGN